MPPPPPPVDDDVMDGDNEAMCSMLMAWYMSGYHTGYYQVNYRNPTYMTEIHLLWSSTMATQNKMWGDSGNILYRLIIAKMNICGKFFPFINANLCILIKS